MNNLPDKQESPTCGLMGTLKIIAILVVVGIAAVGALVVLDVIPRSIVGELTKKIVLLAVIFALASAIIATLTRSNKK